MPSTFTVLDQMPLTANGKIDRKALAAIVESAPATDPSAGMPQTPVQETLAGIWRDVLGVARVGIHDNLFDLGGDSILIIQIVSRAREAGLKLAPNQLFDHQTVATLAEVAVSAQPSASAVAEQGPIEGPTPLAPMQAWFFEQRFADPHQFNQSVCLVVTAPDFDLHAAAVAAQAVLAHHDALRLRFAERDGRWTAEYAPVTSVSPFDAIDLRQVPAENLDDSLRNAVTTAQGGFDLSTGPLFQVRFLQLGGGQPSRLLFIAHHLVVDGVSWRVIVGDFATAYTQAVRGEAVQLPAKTTSFRAWTTELAEVAPDIDSSYWLAAGTADASPLPTDHPPTVGANTVASAREIIRSLDAETTTALLQDVPRAYTTEINDVLLAGLAMTFQSWTGRDRLRVDLEGHGREELVDDADTSRTVGWFTSQFPVELRIGAGAGPGDAIKSVKEQLRAVPHRGAGYGVLRYLSGDAQVVDALKHRPAPEVLFNYFGQAGKVLTPDLPWTLMDGPTGGDVSPRATRPHLLEINAMVTGGCLTVSWTYSEAIHRRETIDGLASSFERALRQLVDHCRAATTKQYTPSDFPAAGLDQKSLDALLSKLNR
jgi:non-ribosomal peptide synthase protein (TIGR01720 family)